MIFFAANCLNDSKRAFYPEGIKMNCRKKVKTSIKHIQI